MKKIKLNNPLSLFVMVAMLLSSSVVLACASNDDQRQRNRTRPRKVTATPTAAARTVVVYPLAGCATEAEDFLKSTAWQGNNEMQRRFVAMLPDIRKEKGKIPELIGKASESHTEINRFLTSQGFPDLQLNPWSPPGFGMASVLKIQEKWLARGAEDQVYAYSSDGDSKEYPGVALTEGLSTYEGNGDQKPLVGIETKGGDTVYLLEFPEDQLPANDLDLLDLAKRILKEKVVDKDDPVIQITFPMVEVRHRPDVSWLIGLRLADATVSQAIQETRFKMDLEGATVESAAAMGVTRGGGPRLYTINEPFLCIISRPGLSQPLLVAYLKEDSWRQPSGGE